MARLVEWARRVVLDDWRVRRALPFGAVLLCVTVFVVTAFYLNHPGVEFYPDSDGYLGAAAHVMARGRLADAVRLPGYPLLIALVFWVGGRGNFALLSAAQGVLFIAATLEVYALGLLVWRRTWIAFAIGLLVGTNLYLLKYVKPITADGLALWLVVSLALAAVVFARTLRAWALWVVAGLLLVLFMTRPEWIYAPVPLFALLMLVAARRGRLRRLWPHALAAVVVCYAALGMYVARNAADTGYAGVTAVQNVNLLGKVMQYGMQDEAPPRYAAIARLVDGYRAGGHAGPWALIVANPVLGANYSAVAGDYARSVIEQHPIEFLERSVPVLFSSSSLGYTRDEASPIQPRGPFGPLMAVLEAVSTGTYASYIVFPLVALVWLAIGFSRRARRRMPGEWAATAERAAVVALLGLYALTVTTLGGYGDYARIHTSFDPLLLVVIWGSALTIVARTRFFS